MGGDRREETSPATALFTGYAVPLAAIPPIAGFIGGSIIGRSLPFVGSYRVPLVTGLVMAVFTFVMALVGVYVLALIINALAPSFGGEKNSTQALKVAVYSYTPAWVAGVLHILPVLGLLALLAGLYGLYLLYLGLPRLMKCPQEKAVGYTAVVVVCAIVLSVIVGAVALNHRGRGSWSARRRFLASRATARRRPSSSTRTARWASCRPWARRSRRATRRWRRPRRAAIPMPRPPPRWPDWAPCLAAASASIRSASTSSSRSCRRPSPGLAKLSSNAEKSGVVGMMVSKASASYGDRAKKSVSLDISDTGGASGLLGLAAWVNVQGEKEDDNGFERTQKVDGRLVHEKGSKRGGSNEFTVVVASRFVVSAKGRGVDLDALKTAVSGLDPRQARGDEGRRRAEVGVTRAESFAPVSDASAPVQSKP